MKQFSLVQNALYGICMKYDPTNKIVKAGSINGLRIDMLIEPPNDNLFTLSRGLKLIIHNSSTNASTTDGLSIGPSKRSSIAVSRTFSKRLPKPYNNCIEKGVTYESELYSFMISSNWTYNQE